MGFWWFMLVCDLLIPVLFIAAGWMMWRHCPREINFMLGYRTRRSMQNIETWHFAHEYCGRLWWRLGWLTLVPSVLVMLPFTRSDVSTIGTVGGILATVQCVLLVGSIIPTEIALKKRFPTAG